MASPSPLLLVAFGALLALGCAAPLPAPQGPTAKGVQGQGTKGTTRTKVPPGSPKVTKVAPKTAVPAPAQTAAGQEAYRLLVASLKAEGLTSFAAALSQTRLPAFLVAGFSKSLKVTVLAPTNRAFRAFYQDSTATTCKRPLQTTLSLHILPGLHSGAELQAAAPYTLVPSLTAVPISKIYTSVLQLGLVNGLKKDIWVARVVKPDAVATKTFVVHIINKVIPFPC